ncbi:MAG: twin-arginine translocase TatA/TatE family subunit [Nitrospinota bacterium]|nr:twin-arginine translocase TatA/TatE family subunit [Nitrospinota bacterium]
MPFNMGFTELLVILAICVLVFGAKRLPDIGSGLAKGIRSFKKGINEDSESLNENGDEKSSSEEESVNKN